MIRKYLKEVESGIMSNKNAMNYVTTTAETPKNKKIKYKEGDLVPNEKSPAFKNAMNAWKSTNSIDVTDMSEEEIMKMLS